MQTLLEIRRRIHSVENVEQITKAMEMIAANRLQKAQTKAEQSRRYGKQINLILKNLASASGEGRHPFFEKREVKKTCIVIVSSDRGLCGSYNTNVFQESDQMLKSYSKENVELVLMGQKGITHYQSKGWTIKESIKNWGGTFDFSRVKTLAESLVNDFLSGKYDEIWIVYTHFISALSRKVIREKFLSLSLPESEKSRLDYIFEPDINHIYDILLPRYSISKMQTALDEAYASELSARVLAMQNASKNAEEVIESLTLLRNKFRQAGITREMIEIATGSESF